MGDGVAQCPARAGKDEGQPVYNSATQCNRYSHVARLKYKLVVYSEILRQLAHAKIAEKADNMVRSSWLNLTRKLMQGEAARSW